jgi:hypothetical protein
VTAFFAAIAVSIAAPDKEAIKAKETAAWQAYKDKKADDFKKFVSADFQFGNAEGRVARHFSHQCKGGGSRHAGSQPIGKGAINSREKVGCVLRFASCTTSATMAIEVLLH